VFTLQVNRFLSTVCVVLFIGLLVLDQHLLVDDPCHSVRIQENPDARMQFNAFNADRPN